MAFEIPRPEQRKGVFGGFANMPIPPPYPVWLYHEELEPRLAENPEEEKGLRAQGYDAINAGMMANKTMVNWYWDLEDLSAKQLAVFAKEEYGVDLPAEAGQEILYKSVCQLVRSAPQNENRLVFIAQLMEMNLDATVAEIKRMSGGGRDIEFETETFEVDL